MYLSVVVVVLWSGNHLSNGDLLGFCSCRILSKTSLFRPSSGLDLNFSADWLLNESSWRTYSSSCVMMDIVVFIIVLCVNASGRRLALLPPDRTLASNKRHSVAVHGQWRRSALLPRHVRHVAVTEHKRRVIQLLCGDTAWTWTCLPWLSSCWSVVADTLVLILTPVTSSWCWSVVADTLVLILTPVTSSWCWSVVADSLVLIHTPVTSSWCSSVVADTLVLILTPVTSSWCWSVVADSLVLILTHVTSSWCWSVVADTLVLILTSVTSSWCWPVVADTLVLILTPVTSSWCWSVVADSSVDTYTCYIIMMLVSCSRHTSVNTYICEIECWSVVADTLVLILTPVTLSVG